MTDGLINCKMVKDIIEEEEISKIMANKGHDDKTLRQEKRIHRKRKSTYKRQTYCFLCHPGQLQQPSTSQLSYIVPLIFLLSISH